MRCKGGHGKELNKTKLVLYLLIESNNTMTNTIRTLVIGFLAGLAGAYAFMSYQAELQARKKIPTETEYRTASYEAPEYKPTVVIPSEPTSFVSPSGAIQR